MTVRSLNAVPGVCLPRYPHGWRARAGECSARRVPSATSGATPTAPSRPASGGRFYALCSLPASLSLLRMLSFLLAALLASGPPTTPLQSAPTSPDLAKTRQVQGKYVFCYTQPVAPYDVAFSFASTYAPSEKMTVNDVVSGCLTGALTEAGAQLKPFDAIILQPGARDIAIKFKDTVAPADRALATVPKQQGKYLFVYCEPVAEYQVVKTEKVAWYNHAFGGAYYSIPTVEANLLKTAQKQATVQAIILTETASYVTFK
jgi:hypothetical protein